MPNWLGGPELFIILIIVVLLFGVGRLSRIGGELGKGIREFRQGLQGDEEPEERTQPEDQAEGTDEQ
jgi:sec-independent protein translocase protein TatA